MVVKPHCCRRQQGLRRQTQCGARIGCKCPRSFPRQRKFGRKKATAAVILTELIGYAGCSARALAATSDPTHRCGCPPGHRFHSRLWLECLQFSVECDAAGNVPPDTPETRLGRGLFACRWSRTGNRRTVNQNWSSKAFLRPFLGGTASSRRKRRNSGRFADLAPDIRKTSECFGPSIRTPACALWEV